MGYSSMPVAAACRRDTGMRLGERRDWTASRDHTACIKLPFQAAHSYLPACRQLSVCVQCARLSNLQQCRLPSDGERRRLHL